MDQTTLEWQTFNGSIPNGAVSIYNDYAKRTDYVAKYNVCSGFYNPDMGPYCFYSWYHKEHRGSPFEILVNKDNFEFLEWKDGSYGSLPDNSIVVSEIRKVYVGKNKYGLGKVDVKNKAFFLPWEGKEYSYKSYYQVLTFDRDIISEHISDVRYKTDGVAIIKYPPETMDKSVITNNCLEELTGTVKLEKKTEVEHKWDPGFSFTAGVKKSITAGIPVIGSVDIDISASITKEFSERNSHTDSHTHSLTVNYKVPPKNCCTVRMVGYKYSADVPYTATLIRTYRNGRTTPLSITGTYKGVQFGEVRAVVDPFEPQAY